MGKEQELVLGLKELKNSLQGVKQGGAIMKAVEFSTEDFKSWCKDNSKNPAFTKNMVEYLELMSEPEQEERKYEKVSLVDIFKPSDLEEEQDNIVVFRNEFNDGGVMTNSAVAGTFNNHCLAQNTMMLAHIFLGNKPEQSPKNISDDEIDLIQAALTVLTDLIDNNRE